MYIRDVMVRNGDAHKAIWLSELSWNAVPPESGIPPIYGQVSPEQQARYAALAYQRLQQEWPWLGVGFYWFFKQADDRERENNPQYYFRMVEPDFSPMPVYNGIKRQANQPPVMYQGWHQADHWAVKLAGAWQSSTQSDATFGQALQSSQPGDSLSFTFEGSRLVLVPGAAGGRVRVLIDQNAPEELTFNSISAVRVAGGLSQAPHQVKLEVIEAPLTLDGYIVENQPSLTLNRAGSFLMVLAVILGIWAVWQHKRSAASTP
jgi:hypothetical protein